ncbi:MAG: hypothetical protein JNN17_05075 [Verrucomicrobiaceae bacterium]|nr:hypothetical protein [Verrucomicrobiaceae bacterium]
MKTTTSAHSHLIAAMALVAAFTATSCAQQGGGHGLPAEARQQIHTLFDNHAKIHRELKLTATGYTATTESDDPKVAAALQKHVKQMEERLGSGLSVRRWDPAFAEYCDHYAEMDHRFTPTAKGVRMTVTGRNAAAVKIAQNHAKVVSAFAEQGWSEHDKKHDTVTR